MIRAIVNRLAERYYMVPKDWFTYTDLLSKHFRGELKNGQKFVYCPVFKRVSWSGGDYEHKWCHGCGIYYETEETPPEVLRQA